MLPLSVGFDVDGKEQSHSWVILLHFIKIFPVTLGLRYDETTLADLLTPPHKLHLPAISHLAPRPRNPIIEGVQIRVDRYEDTRASSLLTTKAPGSEPGWMDGTHAQGA